MFIDFDGDGSDEFVYFGNGGIVGVRVSGGLVVVWFDEDMFWKNQVIGWLEMGVVFVHVEVIEIEEVLGIDFGGMGPDLLVFFGDDFGDNLWVVVEVGDDRWNFLWVVAEVVFGKYW